ncbi:hypothetical protein [Spiroplasma endosymbiont of Aspidapion aeneum]|uniref:hypothetical protein n=1 Tax=Spiroplasma endosymbiont of Aspidapion aeneum TaxID=3066276 RepID=UPI00313D1770
MAKNNKLDPEFLKRLGYSRTEAALVRGTHPLSLEHVDDNFENLPQGVKNSIAIKKNIATILNKGQTDNSITSMRARHTIDGKALDRKRAVELREQRKSIFDENRKNHKYSG